MANLCIYDVEKFPKTSIFDYCSALILTANDLIIDMFFFLSLIEHPFFARVFLICNQNMQLDVSGWKIFEFVHAFTNIAFFRQETQKTI